MNSTLAVSNGMKKHSQIKIDKIDSINYGITVKGFDAANSIDEDIEILKEKIYREKIVVLKNQKLTPKEFVSFARKFGRIREYYEEMYRHKEEREIFVSSNVNHDGKFEGVPKTGKFWHSDYAFMDQPFAFTITYPQIVPKNNRGTYFIDMADAYNNLDDKLKKLINDTNCLHSVRKYFKIRPKDVYRPINEILQEIEEVTPTVKHPTVIVHPITKEKILYISEGFTLSIEGLNKDSNSETLLRDLLELSGQLDKTYTHPNIQLLDIEQGDIIIWDNRRFIHHAKHSTTSEPSKTYRLTVYDQFPFSQKNEN